MGLNYDKENHMPSITRNTTMMSSAEQEEMARQLADHVLRQHRALLHALPDGQSDSALAATLGLARDQVPEHLRQAAVALGVRAGILEPRRLLHRDHEVEAPLPPAIRKATRQRGSSGSAPRRTARKVRAEEVRDAVVRLREFSVDQLAEELGCARTTVLPRLKRLAEKGIVRKSGALGVRRGGRPGRRPEIWEYVRPTEAGAAAQLDRARRPTDAVASRRSARAVATGRAPRTGHKEVDQLVAAARASGAAVQRGGKHLQVRTEAGASVTLPRTPSDRRALLNARAELRRAGVSI